MADAQYRLRVQAFADVVLTTLPEDWRDVTVHIGFVSPAETDFSLTCTRGAEGIVAAPKLVDGDLTRLERVAFEIRDELVRAGNPECSGFVFRLTSDGKSSLDVQY
jgi:hypothetical protein